jgi:hypothetical protein
MVTIICMPPIIDLETQPQAPYRDPHDEFSARLIGGVLPLATFTSPQLSQKVRLHLEDVTCVASQTFPDWLHWVALTCPFVLPVELRLSYVQMTAFGGKTAIKRLDKQLVAAGRVRPVAQREDWPRHDREIKQPVSFTFVTFFINPI